ncbi:MAG: hypothetical protein H0X39_00250 [Actinobacteria bacterium]|nr:hypothetical protein [Actinomycetota bacterium]
MALTVTACGNSQNAASASTKSQTVNTTISVGETAYCAFAWLTLAGTETVSFTDNASNTWVVDQQTVGVNEAIGVAIASSAITTQLTATTGIITATTTAATIGQAISVIKVDSVSVPTPIVTDGASSANSAGAAVTTLAAGSITPTFNPDFGLYALGKNGSTGSTPPAGWTEKSDASAGGTLTLEFCHLTALTASNTALTPTPTWTGSMTCRIVQVLYKGSNGSGAAAAHNSMLLGVGA